MINERTQWYLCVDCQLAFQDLGHNYIPECPGCGLEQWSGPGGDGIIEYRRAAQGEELDRYILQDRKAGFDSYDLPDLRLAEGCSCGRQKDPDDYCLYCDNDIDSICLGDPTLVWDELWAEIEANKDARYKEMQKRLADRRHAAEYRERIVDGVYGLNEDQLWSVLEFMSALGEA